MTIRPTEKEKLAQAENKKVEELNKEM